MKRINRKRLLMLGVIVVTLAGFLVYKTTARAIDIIAYYDELLSNDRYTIYTNINANEYENDYSFFVDSTLRYYSRYSTDAYYYLVSNNCSMSQKQCDLLLYNNDELLKTYNNINIVLDDDIGSYYPILDNSNLVINYDESMFSTDEERENYISSYLSSLQNSELTNHYWYGLSDFDSGHKVLLKEYTENGIVKKIILNNNYNIVFDYTEEAYSDDFKRLTSGTLTVKSDTYPDEALLNDYLTRISVGSASFSLDGPIRNGKAFIKMSKWNYGNSVTEKHLVDLIIDNNINESIFARVGYAGNIIIPADEPINIDSYISNYFNMTQFYINNEDGTTEDYQEVRKYNNGDTASIIYFKKDSNGSIIDAQIHTTSIVFSGFDNNISDEYSSRIGGEIIINADALSMYVIDSRVMASGMRTLGCSDGYSACDIALFNNEDKTVEIHLINIKLDNTISNAFKDAFGIKADGTIDIIQDSDIVGGNSGSIYAYYYDNDKMMTLNFNCSNDNTCDLTMNNWATKQDEATYETHKVNYNRIISAERSSLFASRIKDSVDIYPGENPNPWNSIYSDAFSKNSTASNISMQYCQSSTRKCSIAVLNGDKKLEVHNSDVNIKDGKSPQFNSIVSDNVVRLNSVYKDDAEYIDLVSRAYFLSKEKANAYLQGLNNNTSQVVLNNLETHTVGIEFVDINEEYASVVNDAINSLGNSNLEFTIEDLEFINAFYYSNSDFLLSGNFDTRSINNAISEIVNNKHIGYSLVALGGGGNQYAEGNGSSMVLYYDGIAYGKANAQINTRLQHVLYIPEDVPDTTNDSVLAAQKRIDDYLGVNSGVVVRYVGVMSDSEMDQLNGLDLDGFDGNKYQIAYKDRVVNAVILRNSNKMQDATFNAADVNANINVSSNDANYPIDTVVSSEQISNDAEYEQIIDELEINEAQVVDMDLYSPTIGTIKNFNNVNFEVRVPIIEGLRGKKLFAYYINEDGKIEEYPISIDDFMAVFRTKHFSTYIISEKVDDEIIEKANNPRTYDNVVIYAIEGCVSVLGIACVIGNKKKKKL